MLYKYYVKENNFNLFNIIKKTENSLKNKIMKGLNLSKDKTILHTEPHPNDIILAYNPLFDKTFKHSKNNIASITSGFNSVTDRYIIKTLQKVDERWLNGHLDLVLKNTDIYDNYKDLYPTVMALRNVANFFNLKTSIDVKKKLRWLKDDYFPNKMPGEQDTKQIQTLKGMFRESEDKKIWEFVLGNAKNIHYLRADFYTGDIFLDSDISKSDIDKVLSLFKKINPDLITVFDGTQGNRPYANYISAKNIAVAMKEHANLFTNVKILGYRTIWGEYGLSEITTLYPVDESQAKKQKSYMKIFVLAKKVHLFQIH